MHVLVRANVAIGGIILLMMVIGGNFLRQDASTAYWVLGEMNTATTRRYILSSPTGNVQNVLLDTPLINRPQFLGWLPDGDKIIYEWRNEDNTYEIRLLDLQNSHHPTVLTQHSFGLADSTGVLTTAFDKQWIIFPLRSREGVALFRLRHDGNIFEQISPTFTSIDYARLSLTLDDEWLYYQAADSGQIPNAMYRQHLDGTELTELLRAQQTISLYIAQDNTVFLSVTEFGTHATTSFYRIASTNLEPQHIWTGDGPYFLAGQLQSGWLMLISLVTQPDSAGQILSRMRPNGEDFAVLIDNLTGRGFAIDRDTVFYRADDPNGPSVIAVNVDSLAQQQVIPSGTFDEINWVSMTANQTRLVIEAIMDGETRMYQSNLDGSNLEVLFNLGQNDGSYVFFPFDSDWRLISNEHGTPNRPQTTYRRIHRDTGEQQDLLTLPYAADDVVLSFAPDNDTIFLSASRSSVAVEQFWLRLSNGQVGTANYGANLSFSPIIDTDWHMTPLFVTALALLVISLGQSIWSVVRHA